MGNKMATCGKVIQPGALFRSLIDLTCATYLRLVLRPGARRLASMSVRTLSTCSLVRSSQRCDLMKVAGRVDIQPLVAACRQAGLTTNGGRRVEVERSVRAGGGLLDAPGVHARSQRVKPACRQADRKRLRINGAVAVTFPCFLPAGRQVRVFRGRKAVAACLPQAGYFGHISFKMRVVSFTSTVPPSGPISPSSILALYPPPRTARGVAR